MASQVYSKKEAVLFGWEKVKSKLGFFVLISLTVMAINVLPQISDSIVGPSIILSLVFFLLKTFIDIGVIRVSINFHDSIETAYPVLFSGLSNFLKYLGALIIFIITVMIGLILLIVPGVYVGIRLMFFGVLVVDKGLDPVSALKQSFELTKGKTWDLFLFTLLILAVNLLGLLCLVVGLLVTLPLTSIALVYVYRKIESQKMSTVTV